MGDSSKSNQEILTILQGLAGMKKEISKLQKDMREVERQLGDHELRIMRNEHVQDELRSEVKDQRLLIDQMSRSVKKANEPLKPQSPNPPQSSFSPHLHFPNYHYPEKSQRVLELYQKGWSVAEIAGHLSISRDAVEMVLRTFTPGKELEL